MMHNMPSGKQAVMDLMCLDLVLLVLATQLASEFQQADGDSEEATKEAGLRRPSLAEEPWGCMLWRPDALLC